MNSIYTLARLAETADPNSEESPGGQYLRKIETAAQELAADHPGADEDEIADAIVDYADALVPVYTHEMWTTFVDLAAYDEDTTDYGPFESMDTQARVALALIAERLLRRLTLGD